MVKQSVYSSAQTSQLLENQFLVSMPQMDDPNFYRSVVLVCRHNANGTIGIVINHRSNQSFSHICQQLEIPHEKQKATIPVFNGGPVESELGLILHNKDGRQWESSMDINNNLQLTSSRDILTEIAKGNGPERALFILGYSGWATNQLEQEIQNNIWFTTPVDSHILFSHHTEMKWSMAANLLGVDIGQFSRQIGHA